eukprot:TRINITY_DN9824_c0_g1_i2.p1 TRINITY_DN9824_c0_g1~~TRINITY_DN9824_c0_g1_i2.p1  ORF type:complete len:426 (+),score=76.32 TRINITY_DN9824_c0_g1_i2:142-1419(+)
MQIENLKALIEVETNIGIQEQVLSFNGQSLADNDTFDRAGIKTGELLMLQRRQRQPPATQQQPTYSSGYQAPAPGHEPTFDWDPKDIQQYYRNNPIKLQQLRFHNPAMADAVSSTDMTALSNIIQKFKADRLKKEMDRILDMTALEVDPMDPAAQAKIEEAIRLENVQSNMESAVEHHPESFGRVVMLYIDCEVNSTAVKAFVDSGAQTTIMSVDCAARCGIMRLIDKRFAGTAVGVGTAAILGRIHVVPLKIGNSFFSTSITILGDNQGTDMLLGLDMLKKHQCTIDLRDNVLRIGDEAVSFLSEKDIPQNIRFEGRDPGLTPPASPGPVYHPPTTSTTTTGPRPTLPAPVTQQPTPTATRPQQQHQPTPMSVQPTTPTNRAETDLRKLMDLGYSRDQAQQALRMCNGDVELAASYLFSSNLGF